MFLRDPCKNLHLFLKALMVLSESKIGMMYCDMQWNYQCLSHSITILLLLNFHQLIKFITGTEIMSAR